MDQPFAISAGAGSAGEAGSPATAAGIKRRAPIACRRCRRMRSKCIHEKANPPCKSCLEAGLGPDDCVFPVRGQPDQDREYRHPRARTEKSTRHAVAKVRRSILDGPVASNHTADDWHSLPPLADLVDGVNRFTRYYFQLGFIPKQQYPARLQNDHRSVNLFLLLSILSISARLSPSLKVRYGTGVRAAEFFMERASDIAIGEVYQEPTLERCQAFYLLSIAQQGSGLRNKSYINMGIAVRMAALMQLHREETYQVQNPTPDLIMRAESARRTLWMLHSQDSLHSGPMSPVSLAAADITALLPCNEEDFAHGREPRSRAALEGTPPAVDDPSLIRDPNRSLFATLMQIHNFWGIVGRRAVSYSKSSRPWEPTSEFSQMARRLGEWEQGLPHEHMWSNFLLKGYKAEGQDLAYLCVTMMTRICNIVLRRPYLIDVIKPDTKNREKQAFFSDLSKDLFRDVRQLYEQVDAQFTDRTPDESVGAQIAAFCVYSCGLFSTYICKYPHICQDTALAQDGPAMLQRIITILRECKEVWPLAARWVEALERFSMDPQSEALAAEGSMDDGKDPVPHAIRPFPVTAPTPPQVSHTPSLPDNAVLPRPEPQPSSTLHSAPRGGMAPSIPSNTNGQTLTPPSQQAQTPFQPPPQSLPHALSQQPRLPHQQQQHRQGEPRPQRQSAPHHMYMSPQAPPPPLGRQPVDGLGMLIEAFDTHQPAGAPYGIGGTPGTGPYYPQLGPGNDGFEGELQFYIDGASSTWMNTGAWLDTMQ
ncbi:fungal specific transcription factor [Hirsutella rhossiliensis]|uniref:Fungal specific transcription factor domain-containing protein n=1 Tax=Hirsutella rhossiliensis TaxID=111463 RepID=A0A9P8SJ71_9HYPO|nr:fungal specific transcription factor domain-containing protein [Hirsutella rhossiliensis]KAH0963919.1 fungal specific transcription factor domain-containing protein [Hirsutella rhossiliensis]